MKWVCQVCGYVFEGDKAPEKCPQCGAPAEKFVAQTGTMEWAAEHVVGVAQGAPEDAAGTNADAGKNGDDVVDADFKEKK